MSESTSASQAEADFQRLVRVATYAIEDLPNLDQIRWFTHDGEKLDHRIRRNGEAYLFSKSHSSYPESKPMYIGYELCIAQSTGWKIYTIWVCDPVEDTAVNRKAAAKALERFTTMRNLMLVEVSTNALE